MRAMTLNRETLCEQPDLPCEDCGWVPSLDVYRSAAGFYVGTWCGCGPYSRESAYFSSSDEARAALQVGAFART